MIKQADGMELRIMSRDCNEQKVKERYLVSASCLHLMLKQGRELLMVMDSPL